MKHKLLSLLALSSAMFMSTSAFAQTELDDPIAPVRPVYPAPEVEWSTPAADGYYFVYNVGAGQFLGTGRNYGTRSITTNQNLTKLDGTKWATAADKDAILAYQLVLGADDIDGNPGPWYKMIRQNASGGQGPYLCHEGNAGWADGTEARSNTDMNGYWRIEEVDGGYYLRPYDLVTRVDEEGTPILDPETGLEIQDLTTNVFGVVKADVTETYAYTWTDRPIDETSFLTWKFIDANSPENAEAILNDESAKATYAAEMEAYNAAMAIYTARVDLKAAVAEAEKAGVDEEEVSNAVAVYNNAESTAAELQKQTSHLRALIAGKAYDFSGASEDNPLDVTDQVLKNPTFDSNINDWTITVTGQNLQWQQRTDGKVDEEKNWVQITNFIEAWTPSSGALGDGTISQTVYGLPKGKYILECDAMATRQGGLNGLSAEDAVEGAYIFIQGEDSEVRNAIKAPDTQPKHWSVVFISTGSDWLTFGLKAESTTANWLSADNFKLTFYGETTMTQGQLELQKVIKAVLPIQDDDKYGICYAQTQVDFEAQLESAQEILDGDVQEEEVYTAAAQGLQAAYDTMKASMKAYDNLKDFYVSKMPEYITIADNMGLDELVEEFEALQEKWEVAYEEGSMTDEEIETETAAVFPKLKASITPEKIKSGTDLTWLLVNPSFDDSTNGWTVTKDGGNTGTVSVDDKVDYHEVEFWASKFDIYQVIPNMPAGVYEISVQGFSRKESDQENPNSDIKIEMYAGDMTAKFLNVIDPTQRRLITTDELGNTTQPLWDGANPDRIFTIDGEQYYAPNGMGAASAYFATENPQTGEPFYTNHVKVTLKEAGDFRLGVRSFDKTEWTLFDNFKITFLGQDASLYSDLIMAEVEKLEKAYAGTDENPVYVTAKGETTYTETKADAILTAQTLGEAEDMAATFSACMDKIAAAITYLNEGNALANDVKDLLAEYTEVRLNNTFSNPPTDAGGFSDYVYELQSKLEESGTIESNDALAAIAPEVNKRWSGYVMEFVEDNPFTDDDWSNFGNATEAIYNPRYESYTTAGEYNSNGWNIVVPDSIDQSVVTARDAVAETFNLPDYTVYQDIKGLTPGYYLITVDGFYRAGLATELNDSLLAVSNAQIFAQTSVETGYCTIVKRIAENAQSEMLTGDANAESAIQVAVGESEEVTKYIPNNTAAAATYLALEDDEAEIIPTPAYELLVRTNSVYRNDLVACVGEDGALTIGVRNKEKYVASDWTIFANWTLTYLGEELPDAIKSTNAKTAGNTISAIFTIDGRQAQKMQRGINIVRTADGTIHKVLVK